MDFGGNPYALEHLAAYTETAAARLQCTVDQRPHGVLGAVARWADRVGGRDRSLGDHDARHHRVASRHPGTGASGQEAGRHRPAQPRAAGGGRGPGSSQRDFDSVGLDFAERWARLDESIGALRALWRAGATPFVGRFYSTAGISLDPHPIREGGPAIWLGSWGWETGLRRTARLADGWLASAYNTTPTLFAEAWSQLQGLLPESRQRSRVLRQRARDHVVLHHPRGSISGGSSACRPARPRPAPSSAPSRRRTCAASSPRFRPPPRCSTQPEIRSFRSRRAGW
jgi:hypothetical protein